MEDRVPCPKCEGNGRIPKQSRVVMRFIVRPGKAVRRWRTTVTSLCTLCNGLARVQAGLAAAFLQAKSNEEQKR